MRFRERFAPRAELHAFGLSLGPMLGLLVVFPVGSPTTTTFEAFFVGSPTTTSAARSLVSPFFRSFCSLPAFANDAAIPPRSHARPFRAVTVGVRDPSAILHKMRENFENFARVLLVPRQACRPASSNPRTVSRLKRERASLPDPRYERRPPGSSASVLASELEPQAFFQTCFLKKFKLSKHSFFQQNVCFQINPVLKFATFGMTK